MKFIPEIDGVRGIAIIMVMLFHLGWGIMGWLGVNLFFVISGFLITGILLDSKETPGYFRRFFIRRALRIFPIYYFLLVVLYIILNRSHIPVPDMWYYFLYAQNFVISAKHWLPNAPAALNHTWSLAVEEQFYLLWPFVVFYFSRKQLMWISAALVVLAPAMRWVIGEALNNSIALYILLPSNMDALGAGAFLAVLYRSGISFDKIALRAFGVLSALFLASAYFLAENHMFLRHDQFLRVPYAFLFWPTLFAVMFALFLLCACGRLPFLSKILTWGPLAYTGKISYGLYLYHYIVFIVVPNILDHSVPSKLFMVAVSYIVASASWYLIEKPLLKVKEKYAG